jgi:hypothetical protein
MVDGVYNCFNIWNLGIFQRSFFFCVFVSYDSQKTDFCSRVFSEYLYWSLISHVSKRTHSLTILVYLSKKTILWLKTCVRSKIMWHAAWRLSLDNGFAKRVSAATVDVFLRGSREKRLITYWETSLPRPPGACFRSWSKRSHSHGHKSQTKEESVKIQGSRFMIQESAFGGLQNRVE